MIEIPEEVARCFGQSDGEAERHILEAVALEGYREKRLSRGEVGRMLGFDWNQTEEFLAKHRAFYHYSVTDLDEDLQTNLKLVDKQ